MRPSVTKTIDPEQRSFGGKAANIRILFGWNRQSFASGAPLASYQRTIATSFPKMNPTPPRVIRNRNQRVGEFNQLVAEAKGVQGTLSVMIDTFNAKLADFNACGAGT